MEKVKVDREKNEVILKFNKHFYTKEHIDAALKDFSDVCDFREEENKLILTPKKGVELDKLGYEFYNYVFGLMKNAEFKTDILEEKYTLNHYREKKIGDKYLLTTDYGSWILLNENQYNDFKNENLKGELFYSLKDKGFIITEDNIDRVVRDYRRKCNFLFQGVSLHIVIPTLRCNQKCIYCHANSRPLNAEDCDMSEEIAKKTVDLIFQTPSQAVTIEFQGGEPLLRFDLVKYIIGYAKEKNMELKKNLKFRLVTNLTYMNEDILKFLMEESVGLCTSLDGPELVHNKNRGEYKKIVGWIERIKKVYPLNAMMVVTKHSLPYHKEIIDEYVRLGFDMIWIKPANKLGFATSNKEVVCGAEEFLEFWKKSLEYLIEVNKKTTMKENSSFILLKKILKRWDIYYTELQSPCGAAISQLAYDYDGSIYTCDEGRQYEIFKLGTIDNKYKELLTSQDTRSLIASSLTDSLVCDNCVYKPYCGVCPVCSYAETRNIITKFPNRRCEITKSMFNYIFERLSTENEYKEMFLNWLGQAALRNI